MSEDVKKEGFSFMEYDGNKILLAPQGQGWFALPKTDITGVSEVVLNMGWRGELSTPLHYEVRLDSPDGKLIGSGTMEKPGSDNMQGSLPISLKTVDGAHQLYFTYLPSEDKGEAPSFAVLNINFKGA